MRRRGNLAGVILLTGLVLLTGGCGKAAKQPKSAASTTQPVSKSVKGDTSRTTPEGTLQGILRLAANNAASQDLGPYLTERSWELVGKYDRLQKELQATSTTPDPVGLFLEQMRELQPEIKEVRDFAPEAKVMLVEYTNQLSAVFLFRKEKSDWRLDFAEEIEGAVELMESVAFRKEALRQSLEEGKPLPEYLFEDDD